MKQFFMFIDGPMGSGKTTVAKILHPQLKRTAYLGLDRIKWFVSDFKRNEEDNRIAREVLLVMCAAYLKNGMSVILAQGFADPARREPFLKAAKRYQVDIFEYALTAPRAVLLARLKTRPLSTAAAKPVPPSRILKNLKNYVGRDFKKATVFDTTIMKPDQIAKAILKDLR